MKRWFRLFATLRNKTRGHGATRPSETGEVATYLFQSIETVYRNFKLFQRAWVYLYRNLSGKYRVTTLGNDVKAIRLFEEGEQRIPTKMEVYIHFGSLKVVPLLVSDPELSDFFLPNGSFTDKNFSLISYVTDDNRGGDS